MRKEGRRFSVPDEGVLQKKKENLEKLSVTSSNTLSLADPSMPNWYLPPFSPFLFSLSNFPLKLTQRNMKTGLFWGLLDDPWKYNYSLFFHFSLFILVEISLSYIGVLLQLMWKDKGSNWLVINWRKRNLGWIFLFFLKTIDPRWNSLNLHSFGFLCSKMEL